MGFIKPHKRGRIKLRIVNMRCILGDLVKKLLELIDKPVFIKNENGVYTACNASFEKFLGIDRCQILGNTAFDIAPTALAKIYTAADKDLFAKSSVQIYKSKVKSAQQEKVVIFSKIIFFDNDDRLAGFIGAINESQGYADESIHDQNGNDYPLKLAPREFEVLYLMCQGSSAKGIANALCISPHTVADYMKSIYRKLKVNSRLGAVMAAQRLGLI